MRISARRTLPILLAGISVKGVCRIFGVFLTVCLCVEVSKCRCVGVFAWVFVVKYVSDAVCGVWRGVLCVGVSVSVSVSVSVCWC